MRGIQCIDSTVKWGIIGYVRFCNEEKSFKKEPHAFWGSFSGENPEVLFEFHKSNDNKRKKSTRKFYLKTAQGLPCDGMPNCSGASNGRRENY